MGLDTASGEQTALAKAAHVPLALEPALALVAVVKHVPLDKVVDKDTGKVVLPQELVADKRQVVGNNACRGNGYAHSAEVNALSLNDCK